MLERGAIGVLAKSSPHPMLGVRNIIMPEELELSRNCFDGYLEGTRRG